jgi:orotate phosphoribosyltransferase
MSTSLLDANQQGDWADFLLDEGVFKVGDFTLKSGQKSPFFLNFGDLCSGSQLARMGQFFAQGLAAMEHPPTLLFGPAYKGIPLAVSACQAGAGAWRYFSFRKEVKAHGEVSPLLGAEPAQDDRVALLDDVLTTSATKVEAQAQLREYCRGRGITIQWSGVLVGVDREGRDPQGRKWSQAYAESTGVPVYNLTDLSYLLQRASERGWDADALERCRAFVAGS